MTGNFVGSDSNHTDIEASNDITDDDAIVEAANRIATKVCNGSLSFYYRQLLHRI